MSHANIDHNIITLIDKLTDSHRQPVNPCGGNDNYARQAVVVAACTSQASAPADHL
jgi:hypothetical protein